MRDNKLWESRRLILPEMREKAVKCCRDYRFFVKIRGREEERWGCVVGIPAYGTLKKRVPKVIQAADILKTAGKGGLKKILACSDPDA